MKRLLLVIGAVLLAGGATVAAAVLFPPVRDAAGVAPGHTPLHINCPAGSHGKPRYDGVGAKLDAARRAAAERAATEAPLPVERRAFTARN